jgi:hypothetical protein
MKSNFFSPRRSIGSLGAALMVMGLVACGGSPAQSTALASSTSRALGGGSVDASPRAVATPLGTTTPSAAPAKSAATAKSVQPAATHRSLPAPPAITSVTFPSGPASGSRGDYATLTAHYRTGVSCGIVVYYKSGPSRAQGLGAKGTNGAGLVSWTWKIGTNTTRGQWPIDVTCGSVVGRTYINVQ